jgi:hypothetical protein
MSKPIFVIICLIAAMLASCGSDGNGACATLLDACDTCAEDLDELACLAVAEDEIEKDCQDLLDLGPCDIL